MSVDRIDLTGAISVECVKPRPGLAGGVGGVSIHLPMDLATFGGVLKALGDLGFEFQKTIPDPERGDT